MNALGLKYWFVPPWITGPLKFGFQEGRTGLRVSPSLDGLEESCGVKGKPDCTVSIPLSCQFPIRRSTHGCSTALLPRPNGRSYVALMTPACCTSKEALP